MQLPILRRMGASTAAMRRRAAASPHYRDGQFRAHEPAKVVGGAEDDSPGSMLATSIRERGRGRPVAPVPLVAPRHPDEPGELALTWYGHATSVVELDGRRFLLDPVFGERVSPSAFVGPKRLHPAPGPIAEIPRLDAVVISHDHYDHLDEPSIRQLERSHRPHYVVPIGVELHLRVVGGAGRAHHESRLARVDPGRRRHPDLHRGAALLRPRASLRNQTLWAAWALRGPRHAVFFGGDSGPTPPLRRHRRPISAPST